MKSLNNLISSYSWLNLICFLIGSFLYGQTDSGIETKFDFTPATPNAESLGSYGSFPVDLSNGVVNISIPIYTFTNGDLSVPISMSYRTTALRVDQTETWLGLGWDLNAGGVITRTIKGLPDEEVLYRNNGLVQYPDVIGIGNWETDEYIRQNLNHRSIDPQNDEFNFNFQGYSGKFLHDHKGSLVTIPKANLKIERYLDNIGEGEIIITTPDGVKHYFGGTYIEKSRMNSAPGGTNCLPVASVFHVTAYYLYKIEHPTGSSIEFEYTPTGYYAYNNGFQRREERRYFTNESRNECGSCRDFIDSKCRSITEVQEGQKLSKIVSSGIGSMDFNITGSSRLQLLQDIQLKDVSGSKKRSFEFSYLDVESTLFTNEHTDPYPNRYFLQEFSEINHVGKQAIKTHTFVYNSPQEIPPRLSYAQDHWGYFNGINNADILPKSDHYLFLNSQSAVADRSVDFNYAVKGSLSSINYPTGGSTNFYYSSNSVYGSYFTDVSSDLVLNGVLDNTVTEAFSSAKGQNVTVQIKLTKTDSNGGTFQPTRFYIKEAATGFVVFQRDIPVLLPEDNSVTENYQVILPNMDLVAEIVAPNGIDVNPSLSFSYISDRVENFANQDVGGIRVQKIVQSPGPDSPEIVTTYSYEEFGVNKSSGHQKFLPRYISDYFRYTECQCGDNQNPNCLNVDRCDMMVLNGNSTRTLLNSKGSHITYENVTIGHGENAENGKEEVTFKIMDDVYARIEHGNEILEAPLSNFGWGSGLEESRIIYKKDLAGFSIVKKITNVYSQDPRALKITKSLSIRRKFDPWITRKIYMSCDDNNRDETLDIYKCSATHPHQWRYGQFTTENEPIRCIASGAANELVTFLAHPCKNEANGATVDAEYITLQLDVAEYQRISEWFYKSQSIIKHYDEAGNEMTVTHNFEYDNPEHLQLSKYTLKGADGIETTEYHYYPHDFAKGLTQYNVDLLQDQNFAIPIKSLKVRDGYLINGVVVNYNTNGQPVNKYEYENNDLVIPTTHNPSNYIPSNYILTREWKYGTNNKPSQVNNPQGKPTSFIWGYNGNFLVAKIENASDQDILALGVDLNPTYTLSSADINKLREIEDAYVTTFEYDPIYGLISSTDANGISTFYNYDDFGRLNEVKDNDGNILKKYQYHYTTGQN